MIHFYAEDYGEYEWCFEMQPKAGSDWEMSTGVRMSEFIQQLFTTSYFLD